MRKDPLIRIRWSDEDHAHELYFENSTFAACVDSMAGVFGLDNRAMLQGEYGRMFTIPGPMVGISDFESTDIYEPDLCHEVEILNDD